MFLATIISFFGYLCTSDLRTLQTKSSWNFISRDLHFSVPYNIRTLRTSLLLFRMFRIFSRLSFVSGANPAQNKSDIAVKMLHIAKIYYVHLPDVFIFDTRDRNLNDWHAFYYFKTQKRFFKIQKSFKITSLQNLYRNYFDIKFVIDNVLKCHLLFENNHSFNIKNFLLKYLTEIITRNNFNVWPKRI